MCFYPGRNCQAPEFEDFIGALPLIGDCTVLVYAEPRLTKAQSWDRVKGRKNHLQIPVPGVGLITEIEMVNTNNRPDVDREGLFGPPGIEWVPLEAKPDDDRFWGNYCSLTMADRTVHLLHIGIAGHAAWAHFLQPNDIRPARIISNSPFN